MKTHEQYVSKLKDIEPTIKVNGIYTGSLNKIDVECLLCGHEWSPAAGNLVTKNRPSKCPNCHSRRKETYKKALINTHPEIAKWLHNKIDGEQIASHSCKKVDWECSNCGNIVSATIAHVVERKHVPCRRCSDGVSYPEKYMYSLLEQLEIDFETEYSPHWIKPKRYDFYIPSKKIIIEMDGNIGHGHKTFDGRSSEETFELDIYKDDMARQHNLEVIRINCIESDSDFIKNNILNSKLSALLNLEDVDFLLCNKFANSSLKMKVCNLWNEYHEMDKILCEINLQRGTIINYLKDCAKYGLCTYNPKEQMIRSGKRNISKAYNANKKSVICLSNGKIFESCRAANSWLGYNKDSHTIQDNCKKITKTAGKDPITKQRLVWMWYDEYLSKEAV